MLKIGDEYAHAIVEAIPYALLGARRISHISHTSRHTHATQSGSSWPRRRVIVTTPAGIRVPAPLQHLTAHITRLIASYISHTAAISRDQARRCCCRPPSPDCDGAPSVLAARHSDLLSWHTISHDWHDPMLLPSSPVTCVRAYDIISRIHKTQHVTGQVVVDLHASQHHGALPLHVHAL